MMINEVTKKTNKKKWMIYFSLLLIIPAITFLFGYWQRINNIKELDRVNISTDNLPIMTESDLAQFNGSDPSKPIYIGLNGYVYDVSDGRNFYDSNGPYHYLAGKDSSSELNLIGGDIIARKYKVIARLSD